MIAPLPRTSLHVNPDFYSFNTVSGIDISLVDLKGKHIVLGPNVDDFRLGQALIECLSVSRWPKRRKDPDLYNYEKIAQNYKTWRSEMMQRFGYKTQASTFKKMRLIDFDVEDAGKTIVAHLNKQEKRQGWTRVKNRPILIVKNLPLEEIGKKIREISRIDL